MGMESIASIYSCICLFYFPLYSLINTTDDICICICILLVCILYFLNLFAEPRSRQPTDPSVSE